MKDPKPFPLRIYKHFRINEYLFDLLISNQFYFSAPSEFNDPYDCNIIYDKGYTENEWKTFLQNTPTSEGTLPTEEVVNNAAKLWSSNKEKVRRDLLDPIAKLIHAKTICCFTSLNSNHLMWSHYSDSHKGVCLGFDTLEIEKTFFQKTWVFYEEHFPELDFLSDLNESVAKIFCYKSTFWKYEEEIRILMDGKKFVGFKHEDLKEIIFGLRTPHRQMVTIMHLVLKLGYKNIEFKKAIREGDNYKITFEKLDFEKEKKKQLDHNKKVP